MKKIFSIISLVLILALTGCMEIETRIIMQLDGGAVIKETIRIHKELLDFTDEAGKPIVLQHLEKSACEERAKIFGTGTVLTNHAIKSLNGGVKILEAEYKIPDINELNAINPYLCYTNYKDMGVAKFTLKPLYKTQKYGIAGQMVLNITTEKPGVGQKPVGKGEPKIKTPVPTILQEYRNLQPIFKDLLREFKISVVFQCYASVTTSYGIRERNSKPRSCEILSFSGADYDSTSGLLLDNDEVMQEVLRQKFWDFNFINSAQGFANNLTVPVVSDDGSPYYNYRGAGGVGIFFKPSKVMFQKYFEGKKLDYNPWQGTKPEDLVEAKFENIGFDPDKDTMKTQSKPASGVNEGEEKKAPEQTK